MIIADSVIYFYIIIRGEEMKILESAVRLGVTVEKKEDAIRLAGNLLVENGYVKDAYIETMFQREEITTTYIGNGIAIPHGTENSKEHVIKAGLSVIQIPNGVDFGEGKIAYLIFGIGAKNDEHLDLLSQIAIYCSVEENVKNIIEVQTKHELIDAFQEVEL
jgi:PTS system mannitol-specific IIA component